MRQSYFCKWIPHFGWSKDVIEAEHWQPDNPVTGWKVFFHKWWAKGTIQKGK